MSRFTPLHRAGLLAICAAALCTAAALAQTDPIPPELALEKFKLEIAKLEKETSVFDHPLLLPLVIAIVGIVGNVFLFRLNKKADDERLASDMERKKLTNLIEPRLKAYAGAFALLRPTALFFPPAGQPRAEGGPKPDDDMPILTREDCRKMGCGLSKWYFGEGGLLMRESSRDAYFALMKALGRAADAPQELRTRTVAPHGAALFPELIDEFRVALGIADPNPDAAAPSAAARAVEDWNFGAPDRGEGAAAKAKDYVLIQKLASDLRTELAKDIESRDPPFTGNRSTV